MVKLVRQSLPRLSAHQLALAMQAALAQAEAAAAAGEVPVGAVLVDGTGAVLISARNTMRSAKNPLHHAEMQVLQAALALRAEGLPEGEMPYLTDCTLVATLEPCALCAAAAVAARVGRVIYGAADPKSGGTDHGARVPHHSHWQPDILGGVQAEACKMLMQGFFADRRQK